MPTTFNLYDPYRKALADAARAAAIPGTLKLAIFRAMAPNQNTNEFYADTVPATNEVVGTNYTARGNACATITWTLSGAGLLTFDAADPAAWAQSGTGFTLGRRAVLYYDTAVDATSRLVGYSDDFGADVSNVSGIFSVAFDAAGIYTSPR